MIRGDGLQQFGTFTTNKPLARRTSPCMSAYWFASSWHCCLQAGLNLPRCSYPLLEPSLHLGVPGVWGQASHRYESRDRPGLWRTFSGVPGVYPLHANTIPQRPALSETKAMPRRYYTCPTENHFPRGILSVGLLQRRRRMY